MYPGTDIRKLVMLKLFRNKWLCLLSIYYRQNSTLISFSKI